MSTMVKIEEMEKFIFRHLETNVAEDISIQDSVSRVRNCSILNGSDILVFIIGGYQRHTTVIISNILNACYTVDTRQIVRTYFRTY